MHGQAPPPPPPPPPPPFLRIAFPVHVNYIFITIYSTFYPTELLVYSRIWHHLLELVSSQQTTIIITTHYIEEARQAHVVRDN